MKHVELEEAKTVLMKEASAIQEASNNLLPEALKYALDILFKEKSSYLE